MKYFMILFLLAASIAAIEGSKCDPAIEAKIKSVANNIPKEIIKSAIANGKEVVVGTTKGYFPDGIRCLFSVFNLDSFTAVRIPKTGCPLVTERPLKEIAGGTYEPNAKIKRIHVFQEGVVTAFYKCEEGGQAGDPEGLIKVSSSTVNQSLRIKKAKDVLASVGIKIVDEYPSACP